MQTRIHKVLLGGLKSANHFGALTDDKGKPLDLNATAQAVNPRWPPYTDVCAETWELYPHEGADGKHQVWVLRANVRCSCAGPCHYHADHGGDAYAATPSAPAPTAQPARTKHGAALGHAEAMLVGAELSALAAQAKAVAGDPAARAKLAALLVADAKALDLSAAELEGELGVAGVDDDGLLSAPGAAAAVLAGSSDVASDYYAVACIVKLHQRLVHRVHALLARDWPQRGVAKPMRLAAPAQGGAQ